MPLLPNPGVSQQTKSKKDASLRPGRKRVKGRFPKVKDKEAGGKVQSILTQVLDKGHFLRLGDSIILTPGKTLELRCKGSKIGWAYPSHFDTFNDSRLRYVIYIAHLLHSQPFLEFIFASKAKAIYHKNQDIIKNYEKVIVARKNFLR